VNQFILRILLLFLLLLPLGCGQVVRQEPTVPNANAGEDQTVFVDLQCQLDGSLSTGNLAVYEWRVKSLPAGTATPSITSPDENKAYFTPTSLGTYEFELELSNILGVSTDEVAITIVPFEVPSSEAGFYGICAHLQSHDGTSDSNLNLASQMMEELGTQFVRFDFDWKDIEPSDNSFNFSKYENIISELKQRNIKVLGILDYGNNWSDPTRGNIAEINRFADFVLNTVKHFKADVKHWQIWNEPNNENFWPSPNAENYTKLLKPAYAAAKQGNPQAVVVLGGLVGNGKDEFSMLGTLFAKANFLPDIYSFGGKDYFDVASIHPYNYATQADSTVLIETALSDARAIMAANNDSSKELWITELGPLYFPPQPVLFISTRGYSESEVGSWLSLIYTNLKSKCDKLFWYELRDNPAEFGIDNLDPNWEGLVTSGYIQKQSYTAYKNLSK
jgi:hypothetical protein